MGHPAGRGPPFGNLNGLREFARSFVRMRALTRQAECRTRTVRPAMIAYRHYRPPPLPDPSPCTVCRIVTAVAEEFQWSNIDVLLECGSLYVKQAITDPNHVR